MEKGGAARKALQQGGRFLSDLFKGGGSGGGGGGLPTTSSQQQHHHHGGLEQQDDEGDALGSSQQAQSHTRALERFLTHVNAAMAAASTRGAKHQQHQPTLSSSSLSLSASIASSSSSSDDDDDDKDDRGEGEEEEEEEAAAAAADQAEQQQLLRPTFRSVPMPVLQQHADASLAVVDRIATYVDERWRCVPW
jgi:hypothetical protein